MSVPMRAKMRVVNVKPFRSDEPYGANTDTLTLRGVCKEDGYGEDGKDENNTFSRFSPSIDLVIVIANPELLDKYSLGDTFYVDFLPTES